MDIKGQSFQASSIALNGLNQGNKALAAYTDNINASLKNQNKALNDNALPEPQFNLEN